MSNAENKKRTPEKSLIAFINKTHRPGYYWNQRIWRMGSKRKLREAHGMGGSVHGTMIVWSWQRPGCEREHDWWLNVPGFWRFRCDRESKRCSWDHKPGRMLQLHSERNIGGFIHSGNMGRVQKYGAIILIGLYTKPVNSQRKIDEQICRQSIEKC